MRKKTRSFTSLILWYLPVLCVQIVSGRITIGSIGSWYKNLTKASWTPPAWIFGPAWTLLYILMTISVWIIYCTKSTKNQYRIAYSLFFSQLLANALWSFLFFKLHMPGWALIDLGILILLIILTSICFFRIHRIAALLLLPYLMWTIYAFSLNAAIWWLN
jgi:tryptophan-rich sensory protein